MAKLSPIRPGECFHTINDVQLAAETLRPTVSIVRGMMTMLSPNYTNASEIKNYGRFYESPTHALGYTNSMAQQIAAGTVTETNASLTRALWLVSDCRTSLITDTHVVGNQHRN